MEIRDEIDVDAAAVDGLIESVFRGKSYSSGTEHLIMKALRDGGAATVSLVAEEGGRIVGQVVFSPVTIDGRDQGWHCLGPVAVRRQRQGQGIGRALIERGLARLHAAGSAGCVVVGDPAYYRRFGFRSDARLSAPGVPAAHFMVLPFRSGVPAGAVAFHEAFSVEG